MITLENEPFDGTGNFASWANATMKIIKSRGAIDALLTDITKAELPEDERESMEDIEDVAHSLLCISLAPELWPLGNDRTAHELWNELHRLYSTPNTSWAIKELRLLMSTKMDKFEIDGRAFISRFQHHADNVRAAGITTAQMYTLMFLISLNANFDSVVAKFAVMKLNEFTFQDVQNEVGALSDVYAYQGIRPAESKQSDRHCTHCRTSTHYTSDCRSKRAKGKKPGLPKFKLESSAIDSAQASATLMGNPDVWILGSGANASICHTYSAFLSYKTENGQIATMSGDTIPVCGRGTVSLGDSIEIDNVLHVPGSALNVLSVSRLTSNGYAILFRADCAYIYKDDRAILVAKESNGLYVLTSATAHDTTLLKNAPVIRHRVCG